MRSRSFHWSRIHSHANNIIWNESQWMSERSSGLVSHHANEAHKQHRETRLTHRKTVCTSERRAEVTFITGGAWGGRTDGRSSWMMIVQMIPVSNPSDCSTVREKTSTVHECVLLTQIHKHAHTHLYILPSVWFHDAENADEITESN